jgi:hypothetical protein
MKKNSVLWIIACLLTVSSAYYQRRTGPTYAARDDIQLGGKSYRLRLERSHESTSDQPVALQISDREVQGQVIWRFYPSQDPWQTLPLQRKDGVLEASLPKQPPAGKLEYQVRLTRSGEQVTIPSKPAITRFKGEVPNIVLYPHILAMFLGMLLATRAGIEALADREKVRRQTLYTFLLLFLGGLILGPVVQKMAFGSWWTGIPFGYDLTDNKTLIAVVAWAWALIRQAGGSKARWSVLCAAIITMVVFAIPHSVWGSELQR